jgi:hypothetical protein
LRRVLETFSIPATEADDSFWTGVREFARSRRVSDLRLYSFGTPGGVLPRLAGEISRRGRIEFVVDLTVGNLDAAMADAMPRVRNARRVGLQLRCSTDPAAAAEVEKLFVSSMARRASRGEHVLLAGEPARFAPYPTAFEQVRATLTRHRPGPGRWGEEGAANPAQPMTVGP